MESEQKNSIYKSIVNKYTKEHAEKFEARIELILEDLALQNKRSMIIMGCAYLEELCKSCVFETMTKEGRKECLKRHPKELTFSSATTLLYSQGYLSNEIFALISHIRDNRNKYAHLPIIEDNHIQSINARNEKIRQLLKGRWATRHLERINKIVDIDSQLYYIVFENLIYGLMGLEMFIIPNQKLARLQFIEGESFLRIHINVGEINEYSESHFIQKFQK
ncbi:MAG: hypothetical protein ACKVOU_09575 [Cytophagales bacterium]